MSNITRIVLRAYEGESRKLIFMKSPQNVRKTTKIIMHFPSTCQSKDQINVCQNRFRIHFLFFLFYSRNLTQIRLFWTNQPRNHGRKNLCFPLLLVLYACLVNLKPTKKDGIISKHSCKYRIILFLQKSLKGLIVIKSLILFMKSNTCASELSHLNCEGSVKGN